ncbi:hypothetical protein D7B24_002280 [Verticillium nonalfalfae]|uniref:EXPERA domain-containing protein n=1 Tax=Verticillium nonalfalfae TaxID=1051616 RepID=A0A3M9Y191_9PEZI|nr:uncharacterized protein D7B24_002280 [Verticillium nonalfalfae]RNJ53168.1 hypothetical protein D7B24_002280 [Verticillium nonalfalfae]
MSTYASSLPPDLFDQTTLISLAATVVLLAVAIAVSRRVLHPATSTTYRVLFIWHAFDALIHFFLEGSFLYHCFFSYISVADVADIGALHPTPYNYLGHTDRVYGAQAGGDNPFAQLWMVYANADKRWAGADLGVISLELLTVFGAGPLAVYICYLIARREPKVNFWIVVIATAEIYGGFMTFCPEWLTGNINLDTSNWMYLWLYLVFFNMLWVFIPAWALWVAFKEITRAFDANKVLAKKNL